jgi:DNA-directed RNA polymerase subunit K/omega
MSKLVDVTNSIAEDVENEPDVNLETDEEGDNESNTDASVTSGSQTEDDATDDDETEDEADEILDEDEAGEVAKKGQQEGEGEDEEDEMPKMSKQSKSSRKKSSSKKNMEDDLTLLGVPHGLNFDDDDEDDEDSDDEHEDEEYFQKLKSDVRQNFAEIYHPESFSNNYDEIQTLSKVIRNSAGVIIDDLHRTVPFMTKYEKTRILGQRAKQLNEGAPPLIKIDSTVIDGYLIAVKELEQKRTPFIIRRPLPNGGSEYWRVQDLEIL